jgi:hypothetical protein
MRQRSNKPLYENKFVIKQPKPFWRGLFDKINAHLHRVPPEERVTAYAERVRQAKPMELASMLAAALFAKKTLDSTRHIDITFPEKLLASEEPLGEGALELLRRYIEELEKFAVELKERDTSATHGAARGVATWIVSFYSLTLPGHAQHGKDIWRTLVTAEADIEEAHRFLLKRDPTDPERAYFTYRPMIFLK